MEIDRVDLVKLAPFDARPSLAQVMTMVAERYGVTLADVVGPRRTKSISFARHVAMYMARALTHASYPEIGAAFLRDHTTVMHAVKKVREMVGPDVLVAEERET